MFEQSLFFGFCISEEEKEALNRLPEDLKGLFILNGNSDYLQEIQAGGFSYLGKFLPECNEFSSLELKGSNILSLLKRLLPDHPYEQQSFVLMAIEKEVS